MAYTRHVTAARSVGYMIHEQAMLIPTCNGRRCDPAIMRPEMNADVTRVWEQYGTPLALQVFADVSVQALMSILKPAGSC